MPLKIMSLRLMLYHFYFLISVRRIRPQCRRVLLRNCVVVVSPIILEAGLAYGEKL